MSKLPVIVQGAKGEEPRTPVESPNTLKSIAIARIIDLVSEGEIVGLVDGFKSVLLDETPVENADGSRNFENITVDYRYGTQTQDYIKGFSSVENELLVGLELRSDSAYTRSFTNLATNALRVRLSVAALSKTNTENGDISGYTVSYSVDIATDGGPFVTSMTGAFQGKTMSKYEKSHRIELPPATSGWVLRVRRTTTNRDDPAEYQDVSFIESITEIVDAKLRYPNSALVAVSLDASQFKNIPSRGYHLKGRIIRVPSNYDAETRIYTGVWDGTYQLAYTNNPAWVYLDLVTHPRYGLGRHINDAHINKWELYRIAQYCDQQVADGMGGTEPRFQCNLYLQQQGDAYKVLQDLATVFRGMAYWGEGQIQPICDMPVDPSYTYTPSNVVEGRFTYSGTSSKNRHTVALVSWNNPQMLGRSSVEYIDDPIGIARYGIQETDATAVACSTQGQAQRMGRYLLATAQYETQTVSFSVGLDGTLVAPGRVIAIADPLRSGKRMGGRVKPTLVSPTASKVTIDAPVASPIEAVPGDTITCINSLGKSETRVIQTIVGNLITVTVPFSEVIANETVWAVSTTAVPTALFRVVGIIEEEGIGYNISAVSHEPGKFTAVDNGTRIELQEGPDVVPGWQEAPSLVVMSSYETASEVIASTVLNIDWEPVDHAVSYDVEWKRDMNDWVKVGRVNTTSVDVRDAWEGTYQARVRAVNANEIMSPATYALPYAISAQVLVPGVIETVIGDMDGLADDISQEIIDRLAGDAAEASARAIALADEAAARAADIAAEVLARNSAIVAAVGAEATARGAAILVEETARINGDNALAASIVALGAAGSFMAARSWEYETSVESWTGAATTLTQTDGYLVGTITGASNSITSPAISINGVEFQKVRIRLRSPTGGTQVPFVTGSLQYSTAGHSYSTSHYKVVTEPTTWTDGNWYVLEFDMGTLTAGGSDWATSTITGLRFILNGPATSGVYHVDWVAVGKPGVGVSSSAFSALETRVTNTESVNTTQASDLTALDVRLDSAEGTIVAQGSAISILDTRIDATEADIIASASDITNLDVMVNNLGGDNLLDNSSFDVVATGDANAALGWGHSTSGTGLTYSRQTGTLPLSAIYQRMGFTAGSIGHYGDTVNTPAYRPQNVQVGKIHALSGYFKGTVGASFRMYVQYMDASAAVLATATSAVFTSTSTTVWQRAKLITAAAPAGTTQAQIILRCISVATGAHVSDWDNILFEEGNVVTGYKPSGYKAQQGNATALSSLDARVTVAEGSITAQASDIVDLYAGTGDATGNPNVIQNPTFEVDLAGWVSSGGTMNRIASDANGPYVQIAVTGGVTRTFTYMVNDMQPNTHYGISADIYQPTGWVGSGYIDVLYYDASSNLLDSANIAFPAGVFDKWHRIGGYVGQSPTGTTRVMFRFVVSTTAGNTFVRRAKLERATSPTAPVTPYNTDSAVGASARATSVLDTRVTSVEGVNTTQAGQITTLNSTVAGKADVSAVSALTVRVTDVEEDGYGVNLITNSNFNDGARGWAYNKGGAATLWNNPSINLAGATWTPVGMRSFGTQNSQATAVAATQYINIMSPYLPVDVGQSIIASAYVANHRSASQLYIEWCDSAKATLSYTSGSTSDVGAGSNGGNALSGFPRLIALGTAPASTRYCRLLVQARGNGTGATPYCWIVRPMIEMRRNAAHVNPSPWNAGGLEMQAAYTLALDVNGYVSGFSSVNDGTTSNFNIVADNFAIVAPAGGARTEFSSGNWRVYDASGVLRVRMGVW